MVHIIAEAGTNHNGSEAKAKELIKVAADSGADSIKFQIINPWGLYLPGQYEYGNYNIDEVISLRKKTVLSNEAYFRLNDYAVYNNIELSASIFDSQGLELLKLLNPPYVKIASSDLNNIRLLREVADSDLKIILSTGMSELSEIDHSLKVIGEIRSLDSVVLMHCVSIYPAQTKETNIAFIKTLKKAFGLEVGFSDHTQTSIAAVVALTLGASWFEKHFTSDRTQKGLDHAYAMEEEGFRTYINDIKEASLALVPSLKKVTEKELYTKKRARRSLYAARTIRAGEIIYDADVLCVRPEGPLRADDIDHVIGKKAKIKIDQYSPFTFEKIL